MSEWLEMTLGDLITLQRGHDLPESERRDRNIPVVGSFGITGYHDTAIAKGPGVTVGRSGASFGTVFYCPVDFWPHNAALYVTDFHGNDEKFVCYFLKTFDFTAYNSGSAQPSLNRNYIYPIPVRVPHPPEQRAIAHILGSLDDKIELNRRLNATLEATARALFKSWFVDFDPVHAKAAGRQPEGMDTATAALFPDSFTDSELGLIPSGWTVDPLPKMIDFLEGPGIRNWQYTNTEEGTKFINIRCIQNHDLVLDTANRVTDEEAFGKYKHFMLQVDDVVVSTSGTLGRFAIVRSEHLPLMLNTSVIRMRPIEGASTKEYIWGYVESNAFQDELNARASGSVQRNFGPMHLKQIQLLCPPIEILESYSTLVGPIYQKSIQNRSESSHLAETRDTLLPKLVSGELRVGDLPAV